MHHAGYSFVSVLQHNSEWHFSQSHVATLSESNFQNNDIFGKKVVFFVTDTLKSLMEHEVVVSLCLQSCYLRVK